jgi:hypothetical protein
MTQRGCRADGKQPVPRIKLVRYYQLPEQPPRVTTASL